MHSPRPTSHVVLRSTFLLVTAGTILAMTAGCADSDEPGPDEQPAVTYSSDIRAIVETNCTLCHYTGGAAPFVFETYDEVVEAAPAMLSAMESGRMPPWPADAACRSYANERVLADDDLETFKAWVDNDMPEGETTAALSFTPTAFEATATTSASAPYTPNLGATGDDYRCFLLDLSFDADSWVTGSTVSPDTSAVHHVLVYALDATQAAYAQSLDDADDAEGYTCFGGPLPSDGGGMSANNLVTQIASWVPGAEPRLVEDKAGIPVPAGSRLVMQMHYSAAGGAAEPDQTELLLQMTQTPPESVLRTVPFAIVDLDIPAGDADVSVGASFTNWSDDVVEVRALGAHMHLLGTEISATVKKVGGDDMCGLHIPSWDFDWQLSYQMPSDAPLVIEPGDSLEISCRYDNSAENQPVVDGVQIEPRDVAWGDGSLDEMCLMYATLVAANTTSSSTEGGACASTSECFANSDGSYTALMACEETTSACAVCPLQNALTCGIGACLLALADDRECLTDCVLSVNAFGGSMDRCLRGTCGEAYDAVRECADPVFAAGGCATTLGETCGLSTEAE